jgi:iron-sulfur cluster repair protein YtfE (RIC family)
MNLRAYLNHDYNWYRAPHKYLRQQLNNFTSKIGLTNFATFNSISELNNEFNNIKELLTAHANHEEQIYHPLLKGTDLLEKVENEHQSLDQKFAVLQAQLNFMLDSKDAQQNIKFSDEFYSNFLNYYSDYQLHMLNEELLLMPKMRELHGVQTLREMVTFKTYDHMSAEDIIAMLEHLVPELNFQEKTLLILDIHDSSEFAGNKKFTQVWNHIQNNDHILLVSEQRELEEFFIKKIRE